MVKKSIRAQVVPTMIALQIRIDRDWAARSQEAIRAREMSTSKEATVPVRASLMRASRS
jgi:hypothetical protein